MEVKLYNKILKFKMLDAKAGLWAGQKQPKFCPEDFSLTTEWIILKYFWYDVW